MPFKLLVPNTNIWPSYEVTARRIRRGLQAEALTYRPNRLKMCFVSGLFSRPPAVLSAVTHVKWITEIYCKRSEWHLFPDTLDGLR